MRASPGSGSGLGIDAETLRSLGMSNSEINSLLGPTDDNPSPPQSASSSSELGNANPSSEPSSILSSPELGVDIAEDYDDYDEYEYDVDFDVLEEEQQVEEEELEGMGEGEDEEDIFVLTDNDIPENFLDDGLEDEGETFEGEEEEDTGAVDDDFTEEEEDDDEVENGWLDFSDQLDAIDDKNDEEDEENDLDEDDLFVDEIGDDDDEETFFVANDAEMINVDDLDDLEEEDFADELPSEEDILEVEERLIQQQDGSITASQDEFDEDEYEEYDFEDPLEEEEGFGTGSNLAPNVVDSEMGLSAPKEDEEEITINENKGDEDLSEIDGLNLDDIDTPLDANEDDEVNLDNIDTPLDADQDDEVNLNDIDTRLDADQDKGPTIIQDDEVNLDDIDTPDQDKGPTIIQEQTDSESEKIIGDEIKSDKIMNDEEERKDKGMKKIEDISETVEAELKSEPGSKTKTEEEPMSESAPLPQAQEEPNMDEILDPASLKSMSHSEPESLIEPVPDYELDNARSTTNDAEQAFADINNSAIEGPSKAGKVAIGSAIPRLLPKIGRSLIGSPVAVQVFAVASVGNIVLQHMGALKRKRKDPAVSLSSSSRRTRPIVVDTTTTTTADEAFDTAADLDYEESDYVEDVEGYGFGRPRPQRRPQRQMEEEEGGGEDLIENLDEPKKKNINGLGRFGWGKLHRKTGKSESDITIVDTSVTSTVTEVPAIPKKRGIGFGLMGRNSLEQEFDKALKEIEVLKVRAKRAEDTRDQLEIDCDSAMHQVSIIESVTFR